MNQTPTDKDLCTYLIHDVEALHSTIYFKLVRVNDEIRIINKQPYIHKQINCLEKFKAQRKDIDKLISRVSELLETCRRNKKQHVYSSLSDDTEIYKSFKDKYFELK